jgi:hypothetical protein
MEEINAMLRLTGQVLNNSSLYGPTHKITTKSLDECYKFLMKLLEKVPRINLSMSDGGLLVEGKPQGLRNPFVNILAARLDELEIAGFSLLAGMSKDEYYKLMEILITATPPEGDADGFADAVAARGLEHIHAERVQYKRVTEGDVVVDEEEFEEAEEAVQAAAAVEQIMAFLKGDITGGATEEIGEGLAAAASDAENLAGLIMEAVSVRQRAVGVESGESLGDIVVGCLRRTFDGLMSTPAAKTQKGKKAIKKTMLVLEKTVLDRLHAITGEVDPAVDQAIEEAMEEMTDELEIDALTAEYIKKRKALEKTEKRVVKYIKSHEEDQELETGLHERLAEAGLPAAGWRELMVKSGVGADEGGADGRGVAGMGVLAVLLSELDEMMSSTIDTQAMGEKMTELGHKVEEIAEGTEQKIEVLGQKIEEDEEAMAGAKKKVKMSRKALMELLAEIVQELCQSLSAINCAVGMTLAGHVGDINTEQREVLGVASNCARRLDQLLDRLFEIVGLPKGLTPDKDIVYSPDRSVEA